MSLHKLVFDKKFPYKYYRHILFWLSWFLFVTLHTMLFLKNTEVPVSQYPMIFKMKGFILLLQITYCYTVVYILIPKYFEVGKTFLFLAIAALFALAVDGFKTMVLFWQSDELKESSEVIFLDILNQVRNFIRTGPIPICCLFAACKITKNYYRKMQEKNMLLKENANAEMQLLKARVHPHFLFNTLNNIYSLILNGSPQSAMLITKLSGTLHYMINDCEAALVPLEKELQMITDYTGIEKIRYGERLKMHVAITGEPNNKMIAPLLLIPFLENSFKHGASQMLKHPWIKLKIEIEDDHLIFSVTNSKPKNQSPQQQQKNGIGLKNVIKRLALLYPLQHELATNDYADTYAVYMRIPLHESHSKSTVGNTSDLLYKPAYKTISYA